MKFTILPARIENQSTMSRSQSARSPQKAKSESGQSLTEFALALIFVILPILMIFIESTVMLYKYVALSNASREGARAGSIYLFVGDPTANNPDPLREAFVATNVRQTLRPLIAPPPDCNGGLGSPTICDIDYGPNSAPIPNPLRSTDEMTVIITHTHAFLFGALGSEIELGARSSMRIEPSTVITGP